MPSTPGRQLVELYATAVTRLALLIALRTWFLQHRDGPEALAYARAAADG